MTGTRSPKEQAIAEAVTLRAEREARGEGERDWNKPDAMKRWVASRIVGIKKERARG